MSNWKLLLQLPLFLLLFLSLWIVAYLTVAFLMLFPNRVVNRWVSDLNFETRVLSTPGKVFTDAFCGILNK